MQLKAKVFAAALILTLFGPARAEEPRHEIEAVYARIDEALADGDVDYLIGLFATDFTLTTESGETLERDRAVMVTRRLFESISDVESAATKVDVVEAKGNTVVVKSTQRVKAHLAADDGSKHVLEITATARDTWVKGGDGWALKRSEELGKGYKLDGRPAKLEDD